MPNHYFRFKQFTVYQDKCAMKVCTDACLFGAIVAAYEKVTAPGRILDIGTGTGLLALMAAQKFQQAIIDAVETDEAAAMQAASNFQASPWKDRLNIIHSPVQQYNHSPVQPYHLIISNPPFYENSLKSDDKKRNLALHSDELNFEELVAAFIRLLADGGIAAVLLPYTRGDEFIQAAAKNNLYLLNRVDVKQTVHHNFFRVILFFMKETHQPSYHAISIKNERDAYTDEFTALLKPYYLYL